MNVVALAFGLGVAGFDVFGVVLVVLLVASKLPKQRIAAFALIVLVGTVTAGVAASLLLGGSAELFAQALHRVPACVWLGAEGAASMGLLGWAAARLHRHIKSDKEPKESQDSRVLQWLRRSLVLGHYLCGQCLYRPIIPRSDCYSQPRTVTLCRYHSARGVVAC